MVTKEVICLYGEGHKHTLDIAVLWINESVSSSIYYPFGIAISK
jgi:hypothetical protein